MASKVNNIPSIADLHTINSFLIPIITPLKKIKPGGQSDKMRKILIIGIDRIISMDIEQTLRNMGYDVQVVVGEEKGLEKIKQTPYDLIIINNLPHDDGESFYKEVLAFDKDTASRVLFISGLITDFIKSTGNPYLSKPFTDEQLIESVKKAIK